MSEIQTLPSTGVGDCDDFYDNDHAACARIWFDGWFLEELRSSGRFAEYTLEGTKLRRDDGRLWILTDKYRGDQRLGVWPD
jgi:hypothetical protein